MEKVTAILHEEQERAKEYFRSAEQEIARSNLSLAQFLSIMATLLLVLFMGAASLLLKNWSPDLPHLLLLPIAIFFWILFTAIKRRGSVPARRVILLCLVQEITLMVMILLIDVFSSPVAPACFMPLLVVALPALFTLPPLCNYAVVFLALIAYTAAALVFKDPIIARYDIFTAFVSLFCSIPVSLTILHLRARDHEIRVKYKLLSTRDQLSGILNKDAGIQSCQAYLDAVGEQASCMLLVLDLDDFKLVNDRFGHDTGDELLQSVGHLLSRTFRSTDILCRFGGDEFMVLVKDASDTALLEGKCRLLQQGLSQFTADGKPFAVSCSIGAVALSGSKSDFPSLFHQADMALYEAKRSGKGCYILRPYRP
jgi:diguanylate cyclase (GGDEF)-like protein